MFCQAGVFPNVESLIEVGGDLKSNNDRNIPSTPGLVLDDFSVPCTSVDESPRREWKINSSARQFKMVLVVDVL